MPKFVIQSTCEQCRAIDGKWFLQLDGSWESISLGNVRTVKSLDGPVLEPPPFQVGQKVKVTLEAE